MKVRLSLRILFLALDIDLSRPRGDTVHAIELARGLHQIGHSVALVVGAGTAAPADRPEGVVIHEVFGADSRVLAGIARILRAWPAEIVYERRFSPKIGFVLGRLYGLPSVLEVNGILRDELAFQGRIRVPTVVHRLKDSARRAMLRRLQGFVAVSPAIRDELVGTYGVDARRVRVIGNGVNVDRFRPLSKADACSQTGIPPRIPRVVFVGNLVGWRDFDGVVNAMAMVQMGLPDAELLVVGDGPERERFELAARAVLREGTVRFVGAVPPAAVPAYIGASDLGLLPEKVRGLDISPLKLFEYLACARPVVGYRVRGLEILETIGAGLLVSPGDAQALGSALTGLLSRPDLREDMGAKGRAFVERDKSWKSVAGRVTEVLLEAGKAGS